MLKIELKVLMQFYLMLAGFFAEPEMTSNTTRVQENISLRAKDKKIEFGFYITPSEGEYGWI